MIATYSFNGNNDSADTELNSTASAFAHDFVSGSGTNSADAGRSSGGQFYFVRGNRTDGTDQATAVSQDDYMGFTVTPALLFQMDISTLTFTLQAQRDSSATAVVYPATTNVFVRTSADGFVGTIPGSVASATLVTSSSANPSSAITVTATFDSSYDALTAATEFRIYVFDNQSTSQFFTRIDNVVLNGDVVPVPEPASMALLALGWLLMLPRRRTA